MPVGQPVLETVTNTYIYIYDHRERQTETERERETDTETETDRQTDRDRDRQTVVETYVLTTRTDGTGGRQGVGQVADRTVYG